MTGELLTAQQVQDMLQVDRSTVYRMAADGRLQAIRVGRQWRFPYDRIATLLEGPARDPAAPAAAVADPGLLLPPPIAQAVLDLAVDLLGVMGVVTDMTGRPLTAVANPCGRFLAIGDDPDAVAACTAEWRDLADEPDLAPAFHESRFGFLCARALVRAGSDLVAMVLMGGVAAPGAEQDDGVFHLAADQQRRVLATLPRVAAALSRVATDRQRLTRAAR